MLLIIIIFVSMMFFHVSFLSVILYRQSCGLGVSDLSELKFMHSLNTRSRKLLQYF